MNLTEREAFLAMCLYLDSMYDYFSAVSDSPDEIAMIQNTLNLQKDGSPVDPAVWEDWLKAIEKAKREGEEVARLRFVGECSSDVESDVE